MQNFPASGEKDRTTLKSVVETAFRQKKTFLFAFLGAFALAMLLIFGPHKKFASEMTLLVQNARGTEVVTAGPTSTMPVITDVTDEQMNSQADILTSKDVLDEVVDPGWNQVSAQGRPAAELAKHDASVDYLRKHLDVTPTKKSHILEVKLKAQDPRLATSQMSRLLTVFLAKQRDLQRPAGTANFFAEEAAKYKQQWEDAQAKLSAYEQNKNIVSPHDQEASLQLQLADANTQLRNADVQVAELQKRVQADERAVASIPARQDTLQRKVPDEPYIDQLNNLLVQLTNQRTELLTKYNANDRLVQQVDQQIASTKASLQAAQSNSFGEASTNVNPTWQAADESLNEKRAELTATQGRRAALVASIAKLQSEMNGTVGNEVNFSSLQQEAADAQANYQLYTQKRDAAQIADAMDAHSLLNVAVVEAPTYSPDPVFPKPFLDTVLAVFSSLFIAAFAVFLAESGRQTFSTPRELELGSGFPVLATIPMVPALSGNASPALPPSARVSILTAVSSKTARLAKTSMLRLW
jgi:uncharacterized protein involved in exopolysaccharide biosynthesis